MRVSRTGISRHIGAIVDQKPLGTFLTLPRARVLVIIAVLILILPNMLAAGGKKPSSEDEALIFWHSVGTDNKETLAGLIESYNAQNESKPVRGVFQGQEDDLYLKILSQVGTADIVELPVQYIAPLQKKGYIGKCLVTYFRLRDLMGVIFDLLDNGHAGFPPCSRCSIRPRRTSTTYPSDWSDENSADPRSLL